MNAQSERNDRDEGSPVVPADPPDELSEVLSDRYCRAALAHLRAASAPVEVADLARDVAAAVRGESPEEVPDNVHRRVQTWLHHGHLPSLADHGVVAYDPESGRVRLTADA